MQKVQEVVVWRGVSGKRARACFTSGTVGASGRERRAFRSIANRSDPESRLQINACGELEQCPMFTGLPGRCFSLMKQPRGCRRRTPSLGPPIDTARSRQACLTPIEHGEEARQSPGVVKETVTESLERNETKRVFRSSSSIFRFTRRAGWRRFVTVLPNLWEILWKINNGETSGRGIGRTRRMKTDCPDSFSNGMARTLLTFQSLNQPYFVVVTRRIEYLY